MQITKNMQIKMIKSCPVVLTGKMTCGAQTVHSDQKYANQDSQVLPSVVLN